MPGERPIPQPQQAEETPGERPILPPRRRRAPQQAEEMPGERPIAPPQQAEETPGEQPIPPPRRRRASRRRRAPQQAEETPGERPMAPPRRRRTPRAEEMPPGPSTDQDGALERLVSLFLAGAITPQTYVNGLRVLAETPLTPAPPRLLAGKGLPQAEEGEQPRWRRILPVPPNTGEQPRRRRILPAPPSTGEQPRRRRTLPNPQQLAFHRTRWTIGTYLRGWQMNVPQGHPNGADPMAFLEGVRPQIQTKLEEEISALNGAKFQLALKVQLRKDNPDGSEEYMSPVMRHKQEAALQNSEIEEALNRVFPTIQETLEKWTQRGSGWVVDQVETLWLDRQIPATKRRLFPPTTASAASKEGSCQCKNQGQPLLSVGHQGSKFPAARNPQRPSNYPQQDDLDFTWIDAPTPISQIPIFERQKDMAINVFGWDKGLIVHQISKQPEDIPRINLLLIENDGKFHYAWIKDLNRLLYDSSKHKERKHFCERCLHGYRRKDQLEAHKPECRGIGQTAVRVDMPKEDENKLAFQNYHKQLPAPYIIYADFEALTAKVEEPEPDPAKSNTQRTQHHEACSYSYIVVRYDGRTEPRVEYRGPNAAGHFLESLQEEERKIKAVLADSKAMRMTRGDWRTFRAAETCHVCVKPLEGDCA